MSEVFQEEDWYWAAGNREFKQPAGKRFLIARSRDELWLRVRHEIDQDERCAWNAIHPKKRKADLSDILDMTLTVVPVYGVRQSTFSIEAAQIPIFAKFLKDARSNLCNYISNSITDPSASYDREEHVALGRAVNRTLGIDDEDWWDL